MPVQYRPQIHFYLQAIIELQSLPSLRRHNSQTTSSQPQDHLSMETLLSHSFDYLSSPSPPKIRKGLRQVEGLLAQLCLSQNNSANKRQSIQPSSSPTGKKLRELPEDPAFQEFFKLQQSFQWNIAMRLVACLERLLGKESNGTNDMLIIQTLDLIQGVLLLHPPSRALFSQEIYMNVRYLPCPT